MIDGRFKYLNHMNFFLSKNSVSAFRVRCTEHLGMREGAAGLVRATSWTPGCSASCKLKTLKAELST